MIRFCIIFIFATTFAKADVIDETGKLICGDYSVKVSVFCLCTSEGGDPSCSHKVEIKQREGQLDVKAVKIEGCYDAFMFNHGMANFICIEKSNSATDVSYFSNTKDNFKNRIKCKEGAE